MPADMRRLLSLARLQSPFSEDFDPTDALQYETAAREFVESASKGEVIDLLAGPAGANLPVALLSPFATHPLLRAFADRYGASAELLVELYRTMVGSGGSALSEAKRYIQMAFEKYPEDYFVLWELFKSHHYSKGVPTPSFPRDLKFHQDDRRHEEECLRRILRVRPDDTLARRLLAWIERSTECYHRSTAVPVPIPELDKLTRPLGFHSWRVILEKSDP